MLNNPSIHLYSGFLIFKHHFRTHLKTFHSIKAIVAAFVFGGTNDQQPQPVPPVCGDERPAYQTQRQANYVLALYCSASKLSKRTEASKSGASCRSMSTDYRMLLVASHPECHVDDPMTIYCGDKNLRGPMIIYAARTKPIYTITGSAFARQLDSFVLARLARPLRIRWDAS